MSSRTQVATETYFPDSSNEKRIATFTSTWAEGDNFLEKEVAGHTAGMIGQGNAIAHARYMAEKGNVILYRRGVVD